MEKSVIKSRSNNWASSNASISELILIYFQGLHTIPLFFVISFIVFNEVIINRDVNLKEYVKRIVFGQIKK